MWRILPAFGFIRALVNVSISAFGPCIRVNSTSACSPVSPQPSSSGSDRTQRNVQTRGGSLRHRSRVQTLRRMLWPPTSLARSPSTAASTALHGALPLCALALSVVRAMCSPPSAPFAHLPEDRPPVPDSTPCARYFYAIGATVPPSLLLEHGIAYLRDLYDDLDRPRCTFLHAPSALRLPLSPPCPPCQYSTAPALPANGSPSHVQRGDNGHCLLVDWFHYPSGDRRLDVFSARSLFEGPPTAEEAAGVARRRCSGRTTTWGACASRMSTASEGT